MQIPVQISFHGLDTSEAVETRIREKVAKLEQYFDRITGCRVVVERHHRNTHASANGQPYHVSIVLEVPGDELVVKRDPKRAERLKDHEDIQVALRDAFAAAERQLKDYVARRRDGRAARPDDRAVPEAP